MKRVQPTLTGDAPRVTFPAVKAGRRLVLFDARQEGEATAADLAAGLEAMKAAGESDTTTDGG
jgi:hypothetical protein